MPPGRLLGSGAFVSYIQDIGAQTGWRLVQRSAAIALIAWIPSMLVSGFVHRLFPNWDNPSFSDNLPRAVFGLVLFGPLVETMGMRYLFKLLRKLSRRLLVVCWTSAVMWGAAHWIYAGWGIHAVWPFFILGLCYLRLEEISLWRAIWLTTAIHGVCNALSLLLQAVIDWLH